MDRPTVYVETTIVSYLTARLSRNMIVAAHQQIAHDWWDLHRQRYRLVISQFVLDEAKQGGSSTAAARQALLDGPELLAITPEVEGLANDLIRLGPVPASAGPDAAHIAVAAFYGLDYLLTWNCKHIANATMLKSLTRVCSAAGYELPVLCTPDQLPAEVEDG